jgi:hypothetical protein
MHGRHEEMLGRLEEIPRKHFLQISTKIYMIIVVGVRLRVVPRLKKGH